jgi:hypothetical protein
VLVDEGLELMQTRTKSIDVKANYFHFLSFSEGVFEHDVTIAKAS